MWWDDRPRARQAKTATALAAAALVLAACQVRPLYGTLGLTGPGPAAELSAIKVEAPATRIGLRLKNDLLFAFTGGGDGAPPIYRLNLIVSDTSTPVGVERVANLPGAFIVQLTATYSLIEEATGRTLTSGTAFANASFDFSTQRFANERARLDAEDRAAKVVAQDIRTRLAAYFATRG